MKQKLSYNFLMEFNISINKITDNEEKFLKHNEQ